MFNLLSHSINCLSRPVTKSQHLTGQITKGCLLDLMVILKWVVLIFSIKRAQINAKIKYSPIMELYDLIFSVVLDILVV